MNNKNGQDEMNMKVFTWYKNLMYSQKFRREISPKWGSKNGNKQKRCHWFAFFVFYFVYTMQCHVEMETLAMYGRQEHL